MLYKQTKPDVSCYARSRLTKNKHESGLLSEFSWKEVVPCELREQVINENHAEPTAGHLGIFKTYNRLALRYFWPGMHKDVVKFVSTCSKCLSYKAQNHQTLGEMGRPKQCSRPFRLSPLTSWAHYPSLGSKTATFWLSLVAFQFCLITPLRAATAVSVCKFLEDSVFLVHGIPQTVYLDNGSQFISKHTESLFERYKIPNIFFTPKYTPQINTVERYNRTIITCVSTYVDDDHRSWDIFLPKIQFAMNNSVSEATGFTPSFLVYGREIVTCGSHYVDNDLGDEILFLPRDIYAENLGCLSELFTNVQSKLWHAHIKNASHYNTRRKPLEFRVGDLVMKRTYVLSNKDKYFCKKLAPKFIKCRVIAKKSPLVYVLEDMSRKTLELGILKILNRELFRNFILPSSSSFRVGHRVVQRPDEPWCQSFFQPPTTSSRPLAWLCNDRHHRQQPGPTA
ncbi:integrase core domain-containing protein [Phthorimaea operculella]|nr:integrase core domain-containing protein [Phthorimaea operculella]